MIKIVYAILSDSQYGAYYGKCAKLNVDPKTQFTKLIADFIAEKHVTNNHAKGDGVRYGNK